MAVESDVLLRYITDQQSIKQTLTAQEQIIAGNQKIANSASVSPLPFDVLPSGGGGGGGGNRGAGSTASAADRLSGAAGKADMALARVAGTFGGVGAGATRAASDMFSLVEVSGQLTQKLPGVGAGMSSLLAAGVAGAALVALGVAMDKASKAAKRAREEEERFFKQREAEIDARSKTSAEIQEQIATIEQQIAKQKELNAVAQEEVDRLEKEYQARNVLGGLGDFVQETLGSLGVFQGDLEGAQAELDKTGKSTADLEAEMEGLTKALNSAEVAANDAAQKLLQDASSAGDAVRIRAEAEKAGYEANQERLNQIGVERQAIQAELEQLRASGSTNKEVQERIKELTGELDKLGKEAGIVSQYTTGAAKAMAELEKKYGVTAKEIPDKLKEVANQVKAANDKYADSLGSIATQTRQAMQDIKKNTAREAADMAAELSTDFVDMEREAAENRMDAIIDNSREEAAALRSFNQRLKNIRKQGFRDEEDAANNRNFLAIARIRKQTEEELADEKEANDFSTRERYIQFQNELQDQMKQANRTRNERLLDYARSLQDLRLNEERQLQDARTAAARQRAQARAAYQEEIKMARQKQQELLKLQRLFWEAQIKMAQSASKRSGTSFPDIADMFNGIGL